MSLLGFRAQEFRQGNASSAAESFVAAFVEQRFAAASRVLAPELSWFGTAMTPGHWARRAARAHTASAMEGRRVGELRGDLLARLPKELSVAVLDGPVDEHDVLTVFDIRKNETWVTVGVLVRGALGGAAIHRVIDLAPFKAAFTPSESEGLVPPEVA